MSLQSWYVLKRTHQNSKMLGYWLLRNFSLGALDLAGTPQSKKGSRGQVVIRQFWLGIKSTEGVMGKQLEILPWATSLCASYAKQPCFPLSPGQSVISVVLLRWQECEGKQTEAHLNNRLSSAAYELCDLGKLLNLSFRNLFTWFQWANNIGDKDQFRQTHGWRAH